MQSSTKHDACLELATGQRFFGFSFGFKAKTEAELCFTTSSTGYQHTVTDPSFAGQFVVFTFPHIGNVGINLSDHESSKPFCSGIVTRDLPLDCNHFLQTESIKDWLKRNKIPAIYGLDTRAITKIITKNGPQNAVMHFDLHAAEFRDKHQVKSLKPVSEELSKNVAGFSGACYKKAEEKNKSGSECANKDLLCLKKIAVIDFGVKSGIVKNLLKFFDVGVLDSSPGFAKSIRQGNFDGVVLSNGPGDPAETFKYLKDDFTELLSFNLPILGICLGHQILATAFGCKTVKMDVGHRGANHPVLNVKTGKIEITSQNHGFAVEKKSVLEKTNIEITHLSLFDNSVEGIRVKGRKISSVQHHPEGSPGPCDSLYIFQEFADEINSR